MPPNQSGTVVSFRDPPFIHPLNQKWGTAVVSAGALHGSSES